MSTTATPVAMELQQVSNSSESAPRGSIGLIYRELVAPGLFLEMALEKLFVNAKSEFQDVSVVQTYFGKTLITDGMTQSSQFDEFAYHESLVHPPLLKFASAAGRPPRTVFIGGGGELATAREVLRHVSVDRVVMVDLDAKVVNLCKEHLSEWGGEAVASDPRLELVIGDAHAYMLNTTEQFDVIIMDISDPVEAGPGIALYTKEFYEYAVTRLNPGGVFVTQSGVADSIPAVTVDFKSNEDDTMSFAPILNTLQSVFTVALPYTTNIPSYGGDWGFVMAFQAEDADEAAEAWRVPATATIDALVEKQIQGGAAVLKHYDGITHRRMFALTKPLRRYLAGDQRIMTKENPIYMLC